MASTVQKLKDKGIATPPKWLPNAIHYEAYIGSVAYGASNDTSDYDIVGWAIPPKHIIFPHIIGCIPGFDNPEKFDQYMQHHMVDKSELGGKGREYDVTIYGIVKYCLLCMQGNPNMIDSLFVPERCILHCSMIGSLVRDNRRKFLHKGCWPKFKGYALSQLTKLDRQPVGKRKTLVEEYGYDVKFAYHVIRLLDEIKQIMMNGDLILDQNREELKEIRRGEWSIEKLRNESSDRSRALEDLYLKSDLRPEPDKDGIKAILEEALEMHYETIDDCLVKPNRAQNALLEIEAVLEKYKK